MGNCFRKANIRRDSDERGPIQSPRGQSPGSEYPRRQARRFETLATHTSGTQSPSPRTPRGRSSSPSTPLQRSSARSAPASVAQDLPELDRIVLRDLPLSIPQDTTKRDGNPILRNPKPMNEKTLRLALNYMSDYIQERGRHITTITVGGAIDTLLLKSRRTTDEVEIFGSDLEPEELLLLRQGASFAVQQLDATTPDKLSNEWFNNYVFGSLDPALHHRLTNEAIMQNEVVFEGQGAEPGLKLIAAPWSFSLYHAIDRFAKRDRREAKQKSDLSTATKYLRQLLARRGYAPVPRNMMRAWAMDYSGNADVGGGGGPDVNLYMKKGVQALQREYMVVYGRGGIVGFDPSEPASSV